MQEGKNRQDERPAASLPDHNSAEPHAELQNYLFAKLVLWFSEFFPFLAMFCVLPRCSSLLYTIVSFATADQV